MQNKAPFNVQDGFLNLARRNGSPVKIKLLDGTVLTGKVIGFDNFTVIVETKDNRHLLFKHAIASFSSRNELLASEKAAAEKADSEKSS